MDQFRSAWDNNGAIHTMGAWYRANADSDMNVGANREYAGGLSKKIMIGIKALKTVEMTGGQDPQSSWQSGLEMK